MKGVKCMNDTLYAIMYLEINLIAVVLVQMIGRKTAGLSKMVSQRDFSNAIVALIVFFLSDTACVIMIRGLIPFMPKVLLFLKTVYFVSTSTMCFLWFIYFEHIQDSSFVKSKLSVMIASIFVWAMAVMAVVNVFTGVMFYIDENGKYCRGRFFDLLYLLSYPYVLVTCTRALIGLFREENYTKRKMLFKLALFPLAPAMAGLVQFFKPELPVACATLSLATLELYLDWTERMISIDPLTMLGNRKQMEFFYEQWREDSNAEDMYIMLIDANKFKSINDIYGHIEGDAALVRIANAMRAACRDVHKRTSLARYGGDEFVILICTNDETAISRVRMKLNETLEQLNEDERSPYAVTVSIGVAAVSRDVGLDETIEKADEKLYEEKARRGNVR